MVGGLDRIGLDWIEIDWMVGGWVDWIGWERCVRLFVAIGLC